MILYLDTSALVKLYVEEAGTVSVVARIGEAEAVATARVTYAEARAALDLRAAGTEIFFLSFDRRLNGAARRERLSAPGA